MTRCNVNHMLGWRMFLVWKYLPTFRARYSPESSSHGLVIHVRLVFVHTPETRHCLGIDQFENTCGTRDKISVRQAGRRKRGEKAGKSDCWTFVKNFSSPRWEGPSGAESSALRESQVSVLRVENNVSLLLADRYTLLCEWVSVSECLCTATPTLLPGPSVFAFFTAGHFLTFNLTVCVCLGCFCLLARWERERDAQGRRKVESRHRYKYRLAKMWREVVVQKKGGEDAACWEASSLEYAPFSLLVHLMNRGQ